MSIPTEISCPDVLAPMSSTSRRAPCAAASNGLVLADGTHLRFRPIGSGDRTGLAALFARLTPESRRRRFLSPKPELTHRELVYFTDIDHVKHEAVAAVDERDGWIVGVGRYAQFADRAGVADVAVEVADELQGMGVGTALARCTVLRARENGFTLLTATTLWENRPARALLRRLGFRARSSHGSEIELELELAPRPGSQESVRGSSAESQMLTASPSQIGRSSPADSVERATVVKPVLFVLDEDPTSLDVLVSGLARRFGNDFTVRGDTSPETAPCELQQMAAASESVALFLVDDDAIEFLARAHELHPRAKRVLQASYEPTRKAEERS
jgi:RimJ/RimL family protein N-acetyltransferase